MPAAHPHEHAAPGLAATLRAPAKLNLFLKITGRRDDGYHELDTLFFRLEEPCDVLEFAPGPRGSGLELTCPIPGLRDEDNLAHRAYSAFASATGFAPDVKLSIRKNIPSGAGLGGGSSDAAAVLAYLNARAGSAALPGPRFLALGARLGADVPFFLMDGPARATGIGEKLVPFAVDFSGLTLLVACPDAHVNTAWAYRAFDRATQAGERFLTSLDAGNNRPVPASPPMFLNDFEPVVFREFPEVAAIKELFIRAGAAAAAMSGSGAGVFALFRDDAAARDAAGAARALRATAFVRRY
ncbi:MAG: 4-(cytidine 5'-diphospho)-2-C-methyl-D-erythritol kinase [Desulfovibrionaceae bacterium]